MSTTGSPHATIRPIHGPRPQLAVLAAVSGIVYLVTLFATPPGGPEVETATPAQILAYLSGNDSALRLQAFALTLAGAAVVVLTVSLTQLLREADRNTGDANAEASGTRSVLPDLVLAGGVLIASWHWLTAAVESNTSVQALDGTGLNTVDGGVLRDWYSATNVSHLYGDIAMAAIVLVLVGTCLSARGNRCLPRWLTWLGLVAAVCGTIGLIGVTLAIPGIADVWFGGMFGWTVWLPCTAVVLLLQARRTTHTNTQPPV